MKTCSQKLLRRPASRRVASQAGARPANQQHGPSPARPAALRFHVSPSRSPSLCLGRHSRGRRAHMHAGQFGSKQRGSLKHADNEQPARRPAGHTAKPSSGQPARRPSSQLVCLSASQPASQPARIHQGNSCLLPPAPSVLTTLAGQPLGRISLSLSLWVCVHHPSFLSWLLVVDDDRRGGECREASKIAIVGRVRQAIRHAVGQQVNPPTRNPISSCRESG